MSATPANDIPHFAVDSEAIPDGVCVVRITGELDISHEDEVRDALNQAVKAAENGVVVDLTECEFIDSSGVRSLLLGHEAQQEKKNGGRLAVAAASEQILRILDVMGVDKVIPVRPDVEAAKSELG